MKIVVCKIGKCLSVKKKNREEGAWKQLGEKNFLEQYDEKDFAYDNVKL